MPKLLAANGIYRKLWDDQGHTPHNAAALADDDDEDEMTTTRMRRREE